MKRISTVIILLLMPFLYSYAQSVQYDTLLYHGQRFVVNASFFYDEVIKTNYADGHGNWSRQYILLTQSGNGNVASFLVFTGRVDISEGRFLYDRRLLDKQSAIVDTTIIKNGLYFHLWYDTIHNMTYYSQYTQSEDDITLNAIVNQITWIE